MARPYQVRNFDSLLKSRIKNPQMRQRIYKNLLTRLVQDERVVTTLAKCKDLSRVAERILSTNQILYPLRAVLKLVVKNSISQIYFFTLKKMIDLAKKGDEATIYTWINRKEIIPKVFGDLLERYNDLGDGYTTVYKLPPRKFDSAEMGVVEFNGNKLPQLLLTDKQLNEFQSNQTQKQESINIPWKGTPV